MSAFDKLCEVFRSKECTLTTTKEEYEEMTKQRRKIPKVAFIASCGHANTVFINVFKSRNTGVVCKDCISQRYRDTKPKLNYIVQEYDGFMMVRKLLETEFEVRKLCDGCLVDFAVRKLGEKNDLWLAIQLKVTKTFKSNMYSFNNVGNKYKNCIVMCIQYDKELFWVIDGNLDLPNKVNICHKYSKYDIYEVAKDVLTKHILDLYDTYHKSKYNDINIPITVCVQREYEYRKHRELHVPFNFEYSEVEGLVYDFTVAGKKYQEKVGSSRKDRNGEIFCLYKNDGKQNKKRMFQKYVKGDNDFYWFHCTNKVHFYVIPEHELIERGFISHEAHEPKKSMVLNPHDERSTYKQKWTNKYLYRYDDVDVLRLRELVM